MSRAGTNGTARREVLESATDWVMVKRERVRGK